MGSGYAIQTLHFNKTQPPKISQTGQWLALVPLEPEIAMSYGVMQLATYPSVTQNDAADTSSLFHRALYHETPADPSL